VWQLLWVGVLVLAGQHSAFGQRGVELLNSERIEAAFGSYGIEVLDSDDGVRVSDLYSIDPATDERTTRTIAVVRYPPVVDPAFAEPHRQILEGASIGATLKAAGWEVLKSHLFLGERLSSPSLEDRMRLASRHTLAMHAYRLEIVRGEQRFEYADILEIHHPAYLAIEQVRRIYAPDWVATDNADIDLLTVALSARGF
jgi:hypothetical protein